MPAHERELISGVRLCVGHIFFKRFCNPVLAFSWSIRTNHPNSCCFASRMNSPITARSRMAATPHISYPKAPLVQIHPSPFLTTTQPHLMMLPHRKEPSLQLPSILAIPAQARSANLRARIVFAVVPVDVGGAVVKGVD